MAKILEMPKLSPTMEEGVLSTWHKKEGDPVSVDDLLAEVETDKATMEFRAFDKTTLLKILVPAGSNVKLGQPVAIIGTPGEDIAALSAKAAGAGAGAATPVRPSPAAASSDAALATQNKAAPRTDANAPAPPAAQSAPRKPLVASVLDRTAFPGELSTVGSGAMAVETNGHGGGRVFASPYVRKVAREMGIHLEGAQGSGPGGRVIASDLESMRAGAPPVSLARVPSAAPAGAPAARGGGGLALEGPEVRPLSPMRKTIARRLTEAKQTVPHFYLSIDVDASPLAALRERINAELAASGEARSRANGESAGPLKVSLNDLLVRACAVALVQVPECNATFTTEAILVHKRIDISVAVAVPDGLVTPVVRNADQKSVVTIAREVRELAARARARKLKPEEMTDGTFSISNLGMFGIDQFAAVINPPEGAILAVGQVREVPVVSEGTVKAGKRLAMTLSCDHRVVDGAVGAAFLAELRRLVEHPLRVLTG